MVVVSKLYCEHALRDCMGCIGRCTETRCMAVVTAAIQTIHRTYLVPRPLYDHTAYTASLSHRRPYSLYIIQPIHHTAHLAAPLVLDLPFSVCG